MASTSDKICSLCCCFQLQFLKNIELKEKVDKYLQIKMEYDTMNICLNCCNSLQNFHEFYEKVHTAQKTLEEEIRKLQEKHDSNIIESNTNASEKSSSVLETNTLYDQLEVLNNQTPKDNGLEVPLEYNDNNESILEKTEKKSKNSRLHLPNEIEKKMLEFYNIKCEKCEDTKFSSFKMLNKHYVTVHNTQGYIKCCKRNIRVNDKYYLRNHMFKHLEPDSCRCRVCGKELSSLATLRHHMILHKPTEERPFQCKECDKRFCCKNDLRNHEKAIHVPENEREDYICDVCGKVFQKVANLRYHHSTVHLQEKKYICEICAKPFTTQSGLRTHINAAHTSLKPIQCHECNKWLKTKDTYQKHLQLHQNNTYPCIHCNKICNSSASLRSHLVKHSEERPFTCSTCKKSFKTKTHLKNHSTQHIGGSHFKCPHCPKLFVNMSNYYTHRKRMHPNESTDKKPVQVNDIKVIKTPIENYNHTVRQNIIISPIKYL